MSVIAAPNLRHVTDAELGLGRRKAGRGFRFIDSHGATIRNTQTLARIRALAIPPAWTDVWICESANG
ncbi:MAG: DNA topoisomerase IB, partial [Acidimicrobiia bacterium]